MGQQAKREFTGVWIPKHILEDKKLKPVDRLIYAEISCFEVCTMTNKTLSERAGCSEDTASRSVGRLKEKGYIKIIGFNGRVRKMQSLYITPPQNDEAASAKAPKQTPQSQAQDNSIENKENKESKASGVKASKEDEERISVLYYKVIKELELPNSNNTVTRKKIKQMANEISLKQATWYLQFLLHYYEEWEHSYKPEINKALDIYEKRKAIIDKLKTGER